MLTEVGQSYRDTDRMTLPEFNGLMEHWKDHPPVPMLVRAYLGVGDKPKAEKASKEGLMRLKQLAGG